MISSHGRVQNVDGMRYTPIPTKSGYSTVNIAKMSWWFHRIVHVLFNDRSLSSWFPGATVDHIDRNSNNNCSTNLRWATRTEQRSNQAPRIRRLQTVPVVQTKIATGVSKVFKTREAAASASNVAVNTIDQVLLGKYKSAQGFTFEWLPDQCAIENEQWSCINNSNRMLSSKGRLRFKNGMVYYPTTGPSGYCQCPSNWGSNYIHCLVMLAFGPPCPSSCHTVDHINRVKSDNRIENLRWATPSSQRRNQTRKQERKTKAWYGRPVGSSDWTPYTTSYIASQQTGVSIAAISNVTNSVSRRKTAAGHNGVRYEFKEWKQPDQDDLVGEEWIAIEPDDWKEGGVYACLRVCRKRE